jgi:hypothetical protein
MPSPTPPREVICIACGVPRCLHPIPTDRVDADDVVEAYRWNVPPRAANIAIMIPGCRGCYQEAP